MESECCLVLLCPGDAQDCIIIKLLVSKHCSSCAAASRPAMLLDCKIINVTDYCSVLCCSGGAGGCVSFQGRLLDPPSWAGARSLLSSAALPGQNVSVDFLYHCQNKCSRQSRARNVIIIRLLSFCLKVS